MGTLPLLLTVTVLCKEIFLYFCPVNMFIFTYMSAYVCTVCMHYSQGPGDGVGSPGIGVTDGCKLL